MTLACSKTRLTKIANNEKPIATTSASTMTIALGDMAEVGMSWLPDLGSNQGPAD